MLLRAKKHIDMKKVLILVISLVFLTATFGLNSLASATISVQHALITKNASNGRPPAYGSGSDLIAPSGNVIVFKTQASTLTSPNMGPGVYSSDLRTNVIERLDVSTGGVSGNDATTTRPVQISSTGRYVVMSSRASNLIDGVTMPTNYENLYLRDLVAKTTILITKNAQGVPADAASLAFGVSSDGRFVLFSSTATNLYEGEALTGNNIYLLDRIENSFTIINKKLDGTVMRSTWNEAAMNCDGSLIAFTSAARMIPSEPNSNHVDVYLLDRRGPVEKLKNLTGFSNAAGLAPTVSCNGDYVGFSSQATNIDTGVSAPGRYLYYNPYVYDRINDRYHFVSMTTADQPVASPVCNGQRDACIAISDTGVVAFMANESSLTGHENKQVYARDIHKEVTTLVSRSGSGVAGNGTHTNPPHISSDGKKISYSSDSTNLVFSDTHSRNHVYLTLLGD